MLEVNNIHQYYGGSHILRDVSLAATEGQVTVLLGRNGVGKTTLLKAIMGQVASTASRMTYNDVDLLKMRAEKRAFNGIAYVPQGRQIFPLLTVEDN